MKEMVAISALVWMLALKGVGAQCRDTLPPSPANVGCAYNSSTQSIVFDWRWVGDLTQNGCTLAGYCTTEGKNSYGVACDNMNNPPYWWQISEVGSTGVLFASYSNNPTWGQKGVSGNTSNSTSYNVRCEGRAGKRLKIDVETRDANGNILGGPGWTNIRSAFCDCPTMTSPDPYSGLNLYWGDIHGHTVESDGAKDLDGYYGYAKNVSRLDFAAVSDHVRYMDDGLGGDDETILRERWKKTLAAAEKWNSADFVTLAGWEWISDYDDPDGSKGYRDEGHKNVYFSNTNIDLPVLTSKSVSSLVASLTMVGDYLLIPHSVNSYHSRATRAFTDWELSGNKSTKSVQTLVEIYSKWGSGEYPGLEFSRPTGYYRNGDSVQDALSRGYKMGIIAGSDTHLSIPGSQNIDERKKFPGVLDEEQWRAQNRGECVPVEGMVGYCKATGDWEAKHGCNGQTKTDWGYCNTKTGKWVYQDYPDSLDFANSGLTAVWGTELNRGSIWKSMRKKLVYATSGARVMIKFSSNGHLMGEEYESSALPKFLVEVEPAPNQTIDYVEIVKGEIGGSLPFVSLGKQCVGFVVGCKYEAVDAAWKKDGVYYVRVRQTNGKMAWSSPIWVNYKAELPVAVERIDARCSGSSLSKVGRIGVGETLVFYSGQGQSGWEKKVKYIYGDNPAGKSNYGLNCALTPEGNCQITVENDPGTELWFWVNLVKTGKGGTLMYCRGSDSMWDWTPAKPTDWNQDNICSNSCVNKVVVDGTGGGGGGTDPNDVLPGIDDGSQIPTVRSRVVGDANNDGKVDLMDLGVWKTEYTGGGLSADFNNDGKVDLMDLGVWKTEYVE